MQRQILTSTREAVEGLLRERPGLAPADAARALGLDRTTVQYHLRRLVREGRAVTGAAARGPRYFPAGAMPRAARGAFLRAQEGAPLLDAIRAAPGCTQSDLARRLCVPRATLAWRLGRLRQEGLVTGTRRGREVLLHAGPSSFPTPL